LGFPTILYCGRDECLRVPVLQVAGLRVAQCASPEELERQLRDEPEIAAILFEEARDQTADAAAQMAKGSSAAALVLFRHPAGNSSDANFDLVIDSGTPPARWLQQVAETLLGRVHPRWAQVARDLQARRRDLLADEGAATRGSRIQPERRKCI
jgi:hypothetical protein